MLSFSKQLSALTTEVEWAQGHSFAGGPPLNINVMNIPEVISIR